MVTSSPPEVQLPLKLQHPGLMIRFSPAALCNNPPSLEVMTVSADIHAADESLWYTGSRVVVLEGHLSATAGRDPPADRLRHLAVLPQQCQRLLSLPHPRHSTQLRRLPALLPSAHAGVHGILR